MDDDCTELLVHPASWPFQQDHVFRPFDSHGEMVYVCQVWVDWLGAIVEREEQALGWDAGAIQ